MVLVFTDPIAARLYLEEFSPKSIVPVDAYLWRSKEAEESYTGTYDDFVASSDIRSLSIEELTPELIEGEHWTIRVTPAVYAKGFRKSGRATGGVVLLSHESRMAEGEVSENLWSNKTILVLYGQGEVDALTGQLTIESDFAFDKDLERLVE